VIHLFSTPLHWGRRHLLLLWFVALFLVAAGALGLHFWSRHQYQKAVQAMNEEHYDDARAALRFCLDVWPRNASSLRLAARIERLAGQPVLAEEYLQRCEALEREPTEPTQLERVLLRAETGDLDVVAPALWQCVEEDHPDSPAILHTLARASMRLARPKPALAALDEWVRRDPDSALAHEMRGYVCQTTHREERALGDFRKAIELDPNRLESRIRLAQVLLERTETAEARRHIDRALRQEPDHVEALLCHARCLTLEGKTDVAREQFDALLERVPRHQMALYHRGKLELDRNNNALAEKFFQRLTTVAPYFADGFYQLHHSILRQGGRSAEANRCLKRHDELQDKYARLEKLLNQGIEGQSDNPAVLTQGGQLMLETGNERTGIAWLGLALKLDPRFRPAHEALAEHFEAKHQDDLARPHREFLQSLKPRN
jgi:tetratricopeptide (TPR) repeat protein